MGCDTDSVKTLKGDMELIVKCKWEVRGHIDPMWHNDTFQWWLTRASWKFPKWSVLTCCESFIKWGKHLLYRAFRAAWLPRILYSPTEQAGHHTPDHCENSHQWNPHVILIHLNIYFLHERTFVLSIMQGRTIKQINLLDSPPCLLFPWVILVELLFINYLKSL